MGPQVISHSPEGMTFLSSDTLINFVVSVKTPCFLDADIETYWHVCEVEGDPMSFDLPIYCEPVDTGWGGAPIKRSSVIFTVNSDTFTIDSPGVFWDDTLFPISYYDRYLPRCNLDISEAGLTFSPGETVCVCVLDVTDSIDIGPDNHLGEPFDGESHEPIPFCWEFYIAGTGIEEAAATPEEFGIKSIKPNPFNSSVEITYTIPENVSGNIELAMFDILGRRAESLPVEKTKGEHSVIWQPQDVSSGIYFVRMRTSGQVVTKKLILLR